MSETETALILHTRATDVAGVVKAFVLKQVITIQGKRYPRVEAWMAVANGFGCVASARDVEVVDGGIRAIGEVKRIADGTVLSTGEGFVGDDEKTWAGRPMFARRAMAQTRAISRACRSAFAYVIPIIDAGLSTTPAEEMEGLELHEPAPPPRKPAAKVTVQPEPPPPSEPEALEPGADAEPSEVVDWFNHCRVGKDRTDKFRLFTEVPAALKNDVARMLREENRK